MSFSALRVFYLFKFTPEYSFWCYFQWDCILIFSHRSLLVYRSATFFSFASWFYTLKLSWICLLILTGFFCCCCSILMRFSVFKVMPSTNIILLLLIKFVAFFSFYCPIAVARTSQTVLNRSDENGHICLVPDLRGKVYSLTTEHDVSCGTFIYSFCFV